MKKWTHNQINWCKHRKSRMAWGKRLAGIHYEPKSLFCIGAGIRTDKSAKKSNYLCNVSIYFLLIETIFRACFLDRIFRKWVKHRRRNLRSGTIVGFAWHTRFKKVGPRLADENFGKLADTQYADDPNSVVPIPCPDLFSPAPCASGPQTSVAVRIVADPFCCPHLKMKIFSIKNTALR